MTTKTKQPKARLDLRTMAGREAECLNQIRLDGGFSLFWVTENPSRAAAMSRLRAAGIVSTRITGFPWTEAKIIKQEKPKSGGKK